MKRLKAHFKVFMAFLMNNKHGKRCDVHGRLYKQVYEKFGHKVMVDEYLTSNSWFI